MNGPSNPSPLYVATQAQNMAKNADGAEGKIFRYVAIASMGAMAMASVTQVLLPAIERIIDRLYPPTHAEKIRKERREGNHRER